ncbi:MAG: hypothetical protein ACOYNZ_03070 [Rhodoferax sp.]
MTLNSLDMETPSTGSPHMQTGERGADWKFALIQALSGSEAPRVMRAFDFYQFVLKHRPGTTSNTARLVSRTLVAAGALARVSTGLFLNKRKAPSVELGEAAAHLRYGAIVSLQSVLGECGFLNNPSDVVVAVLPTSANKRPTLGELETSSGQRFRFYGLAERFFPTTESERWETLQPGRMCPTFRPEAALLQWLHLAAMKRSAMTPPPFDVDMELLNEDLLKRLAFRWKLETQLDHWRSRAQAANFGEDGTTDGATQTVEPTSAALTLAAEARVRMLARKSVKAN